ncbi:MAG TPA: tripartite tricarboxylate transporter TctB family protein [Xanthobacteraceae bacterium]|nr:tripartite tricarboxylate transporter TctB family protein [Xanthobacteraceae bacterium]
MSAANSASLLDRCRATLPYLVVLAVGVFLYYTAENFEFEQASGRIGPGAWPKLILILLLASALWGAVSSALNAGKAAAHDDDADDMEALVRPPEIYPGLVWVAVAATVAYLFILSYIGFFLATILYAFVLMYLGHYRQFVRASLLSVAIAFAFMFMFMRVVYVALPVGVAPFDNLSYALMAAMGVH